MKSLLEKTNISDSELFEGIDTSGMKPADYMNVRKLYNYIVESGEIARKENVPMDDVLDNQILEGLWGSILGGAAAMTVGKSIMVAIAKVLGIQEKGLLYDLMTSRVVLAALGSQIGYRL